MSFRLNGLGSALAAAAVFVLAVHATPSHAVLVTTTFQGTVTADNSGSNPFGLVTGNAISGSATYDDALVVGTSTDESIAIDGLAGWNFSITLGSFTFGQADVTDQTFTTFFFNLGKLDGIRFFIEPITFTGFGEQTIEDFQGGRALFVEAFPDGLPVLLEAEWDFTNATAPTPVPVPAALPLFLSGLAALGFAGWRRRKSA
ncbi:MAG: VPLPA-CTERM sorting domain-containing protein [Rhodospirillales bacterium]